VRWPESSSRRCVTASRTDHRPVALAAPALPGGGRLTFKPRTCSVALMTITDTTNYPGGLRDAIEAADRAFDCEMFLEDLIREEPDPRLEAALRTARAATDAAVDRVVDLKRRYGIPVP